MGPTRPEWQPWKLGNTCTQDGREPLKRTSGGKSRFATGKLASSGHLETGERSTRLAAPRLARFSARSSGVSVEGPLRERQLEDYLGQVLFSLFPLTSGTGRDLRGFLS